MSRESPPPPYSAQRAPNLRLAPDAHGDFVLSGEDVRTFIECSRNLRGLMAGRDEQIRGLERERDTLRTRLHASEQHWRNVVVDKERAAEQLRGELEFTKARLLTREAELKFVQARDESRDDNVVASLCSLLSKTNISDEEVIASLAPKPEWRGSSQNLIAAYVLTILAMFVLCFFLRFGFGSGGMFQHSPMGRYGHVVPGPHNFAR